MADSLRFPELETERLRLRQPTRADADAVFRIFSDPEVLRYYNVDFMTRRDEAIAIIESRRRRYEMGYGIRWGIYLRQTGEYVGSCGFEVLHKPWRYAEIGYELGRAYWHQGYMTEALREMIRFGFERMELHRVEAQVEPPNEASKAVLRRLGFREEGIARERGHWHGSFHDLAQFGLLRGEFDPTG
ncbi:MAG TPA: GNAT family N-acetyltransferase [Fimbriimonadaceae bacterium]|nr:GNAT family N-acetyltransferase [Fimbriimonadaceae bacterium]